MVDEVEGLPNISVGLGNDLIEGGCRVDNIAVVGVFIDKVFDDGLHLSDPICFHPHDSHIW